MLEDPLENNIEHFYGSGLLHIAATCPAHGSSNHSSRSLFPLGDFILGIINTCMALARSQALIW